MDEDWKRYLQMAASGALTGGTMGGIGKLLGGSRSVGQILGAGGIGALAGGTAIPAASLLGEQALGAPAEADTQPYTLRAGLGGAAAGAGLGAVGGAATGAGLAGKFADMVPGAAKFAKDAMPLDNLLVDYIKKSGGKKGALLGALLGAAGLGFMSADEGQQLDTFRNISRMSEKEKPNGSI